MTWTAGAGLVHVAVGLAYVFFVGGMALQSTMRRYRAGRGWDPLGLGLLGMALTCGPHHLEHGLHLLTGVMRVSGLDTWTIAYSFAPAVFWSYIRARAMASEEGYDVHMRFSPNFLTALFAGLAGGCVVSAAVMWGGRTSEGLDWWALAVQWPLAAGYAIIAWLLLEPSRRRRAITGYWSGSGFGLGMIFATCTLSHLAYGWLVFTAAYPPSLHVRVIDVAGIAMAGLFTTRLVHARLAVTS